MNLICSRASRMNVRDCMEVPADGIYIEESASLAEAIHQLILCRQHSLIVTRNKKATGILRLSDVFVQICEEIKSKRR